MGFTNRPAHWAGDEGGESLENMTARLEKKNANARLAWAKKMEVELAEAALQRKLAFKNDAHRSPQIAKNIDAWYDLQGPAIDSAMVLSMLKGTTTIDLSNTSGGDARLRRSGKIKPGTKGQEETRELQERNRGFRF